VPGFINLDAAGAAAQAMTAAEVRMPSNAGNARSQGYALQWWIFAAAAVAATVKLSRDAAKGTGFVPNVEESVDKPPSGADLSTSPGGD
jgi:surfeit locus 1 family protein